MKYLMVMVFSVLGMTLAACTHASKMYGPQGQPALLIQCSSLTSFSLCHNRALKECPNGYTTLDEKAGLNRKELRVSCL